MTVSIASLSISPAATLQSEPDSEGDRELARALALLEGNRAGVITAAALRERGVKRPAQTVYDLQLAGYPIDRISQTDPHGHRRLGYRLRVTAPSDLEQLEDLHPSSTKPSP